MSEVLHFRPMSQSARKAIREFLGQSPRGPCVIGPTLKKPGSPPGRYSISLIASPGRLKKIVGDCEGWEDIAGVRAGLQRFVRGCGFTPYMPEGKLEMATLCNRLWPCEQFAQAEAACKPAREPDACLDAPSMTLLAGHPYFDAEQPRVGRDPHSPQGWRVVWRDFYSVKQDCSFTSEAEARAFAARICKPPLTVYEGEGGGASLAEYDAFWRRLAA